jgi:hypothetical protein
VLRAASGFSLNSHPLNSQLHDADFARGILYEKTIEAETWGTLSGKDSEPATSGLAGMGAASKSVVAGLRGRAGATRNA